MEFLRKRIKNRVVFGTIIFFITTLFVSSIVRAEYLGGGGGNTLDEYKQALEEPNTNLPQWSLFNMGYIANGLTRMMVGVPVLDGEQADSGGAVGIFAGLIGGMYENRPISSGQYLADLGKRLEIVRPAYAQGQGWQFLQPILELWRGVRDVTYLLFVVIFVAIGLMIMFRTKLDPQTVISIQSALPKIIMSLILVTFSYAICGLIVDLIYVGGGLLTSIFTSILFAPAAGPPPAFQGFSYNPDADIFSVAQSIAGQLLKPIGGIPILGHLGTIFVAFANIFSGDFAAIFNVIIGFTLLSAIFKIFLSLLGRYVMILLYTIFSPLIFLWGSLPGQGDHIPRLFKSFLGAAIIFPATILLLNFADYFFKVSAHFSPPLQQLPPFSIPGGITPVVLAGLIGLGILMATSKLPETIDDALGVKPGVGPSLGAEAGGALRRIPFIGSLMG